MNGGGNWDPRQRSGRSPGKLPPALVGYRVVLWIVPIPITISVAFGLAMLMRILGIRGWDLVLILLSLGLGFGTTYAIGLLDGKIFRSARPLPDSLAGHAFGFVICQIAIAFLLLVLSAVVPQLFL